MTQDAVVIKVLPNGMAEVAVTRGTACGGSCSSCECCVFQNEIKAFAKNTANARPGERVVIESQSSRIFGAAILLYIVPLILFIAGYAAAASFGLSEGLTVLCSFAAFLLAAALVILYQRSSKRRKPIKFEITQLR